MPPEDDMTPEEGKNFGLPGPFSAISPFWLAASAIIFFGLGFTLYGPTLDFPFVFDDVPNISMRPAIWLRELTPGAVWDALKASLAGGRPVANFSFALNHYFGGLDPSGFRLVNILIHVANGILVFLCARTLFCLHRAARSENAAQIRESKDREAYTRANWLAVVVALLWFLHPLQIQAVTYIVQRMTGLCVLFYLSALLLYLHARSSRSHLPDGKSGTDDPSESKQASAPDETSGDHIRTQGSRQWWFYGAAVACWLLAMGTKQIAATLPFLILAIEALFLHSSPAEAYRKRKKLFLGVLYLTIAASLLYLGTEPIQRLTAGYAKRDFTLPQRVMTQFRVVAFYLTLFFYPHPSRLNMEHHFPPSTSLLSPASTGISLLVLVGLFVGAVVLARQRKKLMAFCIFWLFLHLAIESSVIPLEMAFEHRMYLPSIGLAMGVVWAVERWVPLASRSKLILAAGAMIVLGAWTARRNQVWRSELTLWTDCARKSPQKARPWAVLGRLAGEQGETRKALLLCRRAVTLDPDYSGAYYNMGKVLENAGRLKAAEAVYRKALQCDPRNAEAHVNLGVLLGFSRRWREAEKHLREALRLRPAWPDAMHNLAFLLSTARDPEVRDGEEAVQWARRAWELHHRPVFLGSLATAYAAAGKPELARKAARRGITLAHESGNKNTEAAITAILRRLESTR